MEPHTRPMNDWHHSKLLVLSWLLFLLTGSLFATTPRGLPLSRFHSLDEIGGINGDLNIGFDPIGRLTVVQNGSYSVLNDRDWIYLSEFQNSTEVIQTVLHLDDQTAYYGGNGTWGKLSRNASGTFYPVALVPQHRPSWSKSNNYLFVFSVGPKICFVNWNGLVVWDSETKKHHFFEVLELADAFSLNGEIYITSATDGIKWVNFETGTLDDLNLGSVQSQLIYHHTPFDNQRLLCATRRYGIHLFDGETLIPWENELDSIEDPFITEICKLPDGNIAVSFEGVGLYILNPEGKIISSYTTSEFQNIKQIISKEAGILWFSTDSGIQQVFYGSRVTILDRRQGLPINWPQIVSWKGNPIIATNGLLYESKTKDRTKTPLFETVENQPAWGTWGVASDGDTLLIGNQNGVHERTGPASFKTVWQGFSADRLVMPDADHCYVIGKQFITLLEKKNNHWEECTDRIPGLGYPSVVHTSPHAAWIELGVGRVARISHKGNKIKAKLIDQFPWKKTGWIHTGFIGDLAILGSPTNGRLFYDDAKGQFIDQPECWDFIDDLPYLVARLQQDANGNVWVSHHKGIAFLKKTNNGYELETAGLEFVQASDPIIRITEEGSVWFNNGTNLFHVTSSTTSPEFKYPEPVLISVVDQTAQVEIGNYKNPIAHQKLNYGQNNLGFRLFAGTYAIRNPRYNIHIESPFLNWTSTEADSDILLPNLREGSYKMSCQLVSNQIPVSSPLTVDFTIAPPWYRSFAAYLTYIISGIAVLYLFIRWLIHRTHRHNKLLTKLVNERTHELEETMEKLEIETRNTATLAERNRLAGEIHDSVQQGLSGLKIHLDGVLRNPNVNENLRTSLGTARKMVDYTHQEVQHVLLDMESPFLEGSNIEKALKRIADLIPNDATQIVIKTTGTPFETPSLQAHQLLRISQEALTNAVRHGFATLIEMCLSYQSSSLELRITDNGKGFDPESTLDQSRHFGLRGMKNRAKTIGANISIQSMPNKGTTVSISLPVPATISE